LASQGIACPQNFGKPWAVTFEIPPLPWYKNLEESPSSLDQENTVFDALVEALAAAAAVAAKAALQALADMLR
jgi:hypothetical protein